MSLLTDSISARASQRMYNTKPTTPNQRLFASTPTNTTETKAPAKSKDREMYETIAKDLGWKDDYDTYCKKSEEKRKKEEAFLNNTRSKNGLNIIETFGSIRKIVDKYKNYIALINPEKVGNVCWRDHNGEICIGAGIYAEHFDFDKAISGSSPLSGSEVEELRNAIQAYKELREVKDLIELYKRTSLDMCKELHTFESLLKDLDNSKAVKGFSTKG